MQWGPSKQVWPCSVLHWPQFNPARCAMFLIMVRWSSFGLPRLLGKTKSATLGCGTRRVATSIATKQRLQPGYRLGVCKPQDERQATTLTGLAVEPSRQASGASSWNYEARFVPHVPPHVRHASQCQWGESEGRAGTASSCHAEGDDRHLPAQAGSPNKIGPNGPYEESDRVTASWTKLDQIGYHDGHHLNVVTALFRMAGTTGLEPAASAVTGPTTQDCRVFTSIP